MTEKRNVPKLRFPGFTGEWEERKLSDLVLIERGGSPRPIDKYITDSPEGLNWIKIGDAPEQGNYITKTAEKIKPEGLSKTKQVHPGDLILSNSMSYGRPYIMGINGCIHDGWLLIRDTQNYFDLKFLCQLLGTPSMLEQYKLLAAGSTVNNLNKKLVGNTHVKIPAKKEQKKIGSYLEQFDHLIALNQRKLDHLEQKKKGLLQKLFPGKGEHVPQWRFPGFTGEWEETKLRDLAEHTYGGGTPKTSVEEYWNGDIPWIQSSDLTEGNVFNVMPKNKITALGIKKSATKLVPKDSIAIVTRVGVGKIAFIPFLYCTSQDFLSLSTLRIDPKFAVYACYKTIQSDINSVQGSTIKGITKKELLEKTILIPTSSSEQKKISDLFITLDHLIARQRRKLDHLQTQKKALLQQLFV